MITTQSNGAPDFYVGQLVTVSCTASGFTDILQVMLVENGLPESTGCIKAYFGFMAFRSPRFKALGFTHYESADCAAMGAGKVSGYTIPTFAELTKEIDGVGLYCEGYESKYLGIPGVLSKHIVINNLKGEYYVDNKTLFTPVFTDKHLRRLLLTC